MTGVEFKNAPQNGGGLFIAPGLGGPRGLHFQGVDLLRAGVDVLHPQSLPALNFLPLSAATRIRPCHPHRSRAAMAGQMLLRRIRSLRPPGCLFTYPTTPGRFFASLAPRGSLPAERARIRMLLAPDEPGPS